MREPSNSRTPEEELLLRAYDFFNNRDIDGALSLMHKNVNWPNGMEGGIEHGHDAVRAYWTRQWQMIDPHVEPIQFKKLNSHRIDVTVRQVVKDLQGNLIMDKVIHHVYSLDGGLVRGMEIRE